MAKLRARGRTELFRMEKTTPAPVQGIIQLEDRTMTQTYAFMSDGKVLRSAKFNPGKRDSWTVSNLNKTCNGPADIEKSLLGKGYTKAVKQ